MLQPKKLCHYPLKGWSNKLGGDRTSIIILLLGSGERPVLYLLEAMPALRRVQWLQCNPLHSIPHVSGKLNNPLLVSQHKPKVIRELWSHLFLEFLMHGEPHKGVWVSHTLWRAGTAPDKYKTSLLSGSAPRSREHHCLYTHWCKFYERVLESLPHKTSTFAEGNLGFLIPKFIAGCISVGEFRNLGLDCLPLCYA